MKIKDVVNESLCAENVDAQFCSDWLKGEMHRVFAALARHRKALENLSHAVSACNKLSWKPGEPEPYLLEAAREAVATPEQPLASRMPDEKGTA